MAHQHGSRCYWDIEICGWVCRPERSAAQAGTSTPHRDVDPAVDRPAVADRPAATAR